MARQRVLFRSAAREKVLRGAEPLADVVRVTLGPKSRSVLIELVGDGTTTARSWPTRFRVGASSARRRMSTPVAAKMN